MQDKLREGMDPISAWEQARNEGLGWGAGLTALEYLSPSKFLFGSTKSRIMNTLEVGIVESGQEFVSEMMSDVFKHNEVNWKGALEAGKVGAFWGLLLGGGANVTAETLARSRRRKVEKEMKVGNPEGEELQDGLDSPAVKATREAAQESLDGSDEAVSHETGQPPPPAAPGAAPATSAEADPPEVVVVEPGEEEDQGQAASAEQADAEAVPNFVINEKEQRWVITLPSMTITGSIASAVNPDEQHSFEYQLESGTDQPAAPLHERESLNNVFAHVLQDNSEQSEYIQSFFADLREKYAQDYERAVPDEPVATEPDETPASVEEITQRQAPETDLTQEIANEDDTQTDIIEGDYLNGRNENMMWEIHPNSSDNGGLLRLNPIPGRESIAFRRPDGRTDFLEEFNIGLEHIAFPQEKFSNYKLGNISYEEIKAGLLDGASEGTFDTLTRIFAALEKNYGQDIESDVGLNDEGNNGENNGGPGRALGAPASDGARARAGAEGVHHQDAGTGARDRVGQGTDERDFPSAGIGERVGEEGAADPLADQGGDDVLLPEHGDVPGRPVLSGELTPRYQRSEEDLLPGSGDWKTRTRLNLEAIKVSKELQASGRPATPEEQAKLARFTGWGAASQVFNNKLTHASKVLYDDVREALSKPEYAAARRSVLNAHYTSHTVIDGIWAGLRALGFDGGKVFEPGAGTGHFAGRIPESLADKVTMTMVELDTMSAQIAAQLYPPDTVINANLTEVTPQADHAAAVGNVPFAKGYKGTLTRRGIDHSLHDYSILKAIDAVAPGGVVALITSRFTLDQVNPRSRQEMAKEADLLLAIRLPREAFKRFSGTEVVTDLLVFRKRKANETVADADWIVSSPTKLGVNINDYYLENKANVFGEQRKERGLYSENEYTVVGEEVDAEQIEKAFKRYQRKLKRQKKESLTELTAFAAEAKKSKTPEDLAKFTAMAKAHNARFGNC